ncbi:MAG: AIR synthase-related protein [Candidatus Hodarchaeota archaeon]
MTLPKGKLNLTDLERLVFPHLPRVDDPRKATLDYTTASVQGNLFVASDPVIGVPLQSYGFFAVHYSATDVAMAGVVPQYLNVGIYYPPGTEESWLIKTVQQLGQEANRLNIQIIGGHTGGYDGLQLPIISSTCFGILSEDLPPPPEIKSGAVIIAVGPIARETLWFLANVEPSQVDAILPRTHREALAGDLSPFSVVPLINALSKEDVILMHDLAEGGLATALQELQTLTGRGITVQYDTIPWDSISLRLFEYLNWNPFHCSSFGNFLLVTTRDASEKVLESLSDFGRDVAIIGEFTRKKRILVEYPDRTKPLDSGRDPYQRFTDKLI